MYKLKSTTVIKSVPGIERGLKQYTNVVYRGEKEVYKGEDDFFCINRVKKRKRINRQQKLFQDACSFVEGLPFENLPLYVNHKDPLIRALCLDRLQHE